MKFFLHPVLVSRPQGASPLKNLGPSLGPPLLLAVTLSPWGRHGQSGPRRQSELVGANLDLREVPVQPAPPHPPSPPGLGYLPGRGGAQAFSSQPGGVGKPSRNCRLLPKVLNGPQARPAPRHSGARMPGGAPVPRPSMSLHEAPLREAPCTWPSVR